MALYIPQNNGWKIFKKDVLIGIIHLKYYWDDDVDFETNERLHAGLRWSSTERNAYGSAWRHLVCEDDGPEDREEEKREYMDGPVDGKRFYYIRPHFDCDPHYDTPSPFHPIDFYGHYETMHLTILRSCRQTYVEANQILWNTNTFSFDNAIAFKRSIMTRNTYQKRMISSLRMEIEFGNFGTWRDWNSALSMATVKSLLSLRRLRLQIEYSLETESYINHFKGRQWRYHTTYCQSLQRLSTSSLTKVEICVRNRKYDSQDLLWAKVDRNEYADGLRTLLLDPQGDKIYAAAQLEDKEQSRKERALEAEARALRQRPRLGFSGGK
ncbi:hypothetical protein P7C71_g5854, partial [Lecanoromycetidae sp. Uapishka_2]